MADPARARKIAERIKAIVAEQLEYRVKDAVSYTHLDVYKRQLQPFL